MNDSHPFLDPAGFRQYLAFAQGIGRVCGDCLADVEVDGDLSRGAVTHIRVLHDETCPTLAAKRGRNV